MVCVCGVVDLKHTIAATSYNENHVIPITLRFKIMYDNWQIPRVTIMPTSSLSKPLNASKKISAIEIAAKQKRKQQLHQLKNSIEIAKPRSFWTTSSKYLNENIPFEYKNDGCPWYFNHHNTRIDQQQPYYKQNEAIQMFNQNVNTNFTGNVKPDSAITVKRVSKLSQSSNSDGNNSASSIASDSLLLTAANLERFTSIQQKNSHNIKYLPTSYNDYAAYQLPLHHDVNIFVPNYTKNINNNKTADRDICNVNILQTAIHVYKDECSTQNESSHIRAPKMATTIATVPQKQTLLKFPSEVHHLNDVECNLHLMKTTKDPDAVSIASSMHFTMINGEVGRNNKDKRKSLCDRGHQVTILITSMSILFLILILSMVFALEMRARDMLQS